LPVELQALKPKAATNAIAPVCNNFIA